MFELGALRAPTQPEWPRTETSFLFACTALWSWLLPGNSFPSRIGQAGVEPHEQVEEFGHVQRNCIYIYIYLFIYNISIYIYISQRHPYDFV